MSKNKPMVDVMISNYPIRMVKMQSASKIRIRLGMLLCVTKSGVRPIRQRTKKPRLIGIMM